MYIAFLFLAAFVVGVLCLQVSVVTVAWSLILVVCGVYEAQGIQVGVRVWTIWPRHGTAWVTHGPRVVVRVVLQIKFSNLYSCSVIVNLIEALFIWNKGVHIAKTGGLSWCIFFKVIVLLRLLPLQMIVLSFTVYRWPLDIYALVCWGIDYIFWILNICFHSGTIIDTVLALVHFLLILNHLIGD